MRLSGGDGDALGGGVLLTSGGGVTRSLAWRVMLCPLLGALKVKARVWGACLASLVAALLTSPVDQ